MIAKPSKDMWVLTRIIEFAMSGFIRMIRMVQALLRKWREGQLPEDFDAK